MLVEPEFDTNERLAAAKSALAEALWPILPDKIDNASAVTGLEVS